MVNLIDFLSTFFLQPTQDQHRTQKSKLGAATELTTAEALAKCGSMNNEKGRKKEMRIFADLFYASERDENVWVYHGKKENGK